MLYISRNPGVIYFYKIAFTIYNYSYTSHKFWPSVMTNSNICRISNYDNPVK